MNCTLSYAKTNLIFMMSRFNANKLFKFFQCFTHLHNTIQYKQSKFFALEKLLILFPIFVICYSNYKVALTQICIHLYFVEEKTTHIHTHTHKNVSRTKNSNGN